MFQNNINVAVRVGSHKTLTRKPTYLYTFGTLEGNVVVIVQGKGGRSYRCGVYMVRLHPPRENNDPTPMSGHAPFLKFAITL